MKQKTKRFLSLQLLTILFSLASVLVKLASLSMEKSGIFSLPAVSFLFGYIVLLGVYAVFWQKVLKGVSLSTAYLSKGSVLFWTLLWSVLFFGEGITVPNIIGTTVIAGGTFLVNDSE